MPLRRTPRKPFHLQCQVVREDTFELLAEETLDLSSSGAKVRTEHRVLTGETVVLTVRDPRTQRYVDATATVARVEHGRRKSERTRALGLEFESLDIDSQLVLDSLLRGRRFRAA